jgi:hypothetical protein
LELRDVAKGAITREIDATSVGDDMKAESSIYGLLTTRYHQVESEKAL